MLVNICIEQELYQQCHGKEQDVGVVMGANGMTVVIVYFARTKSNLVGRVKRKRHAFVADVPTSQVNKLL